MLVSIPARGRIFSLRHRVQTGSGPTQPPTTADGGRGSFSGVKRPGREAGHSPYLMPGLRMPVAIHPLPVSLRVMVLG
jgi:hypothetical protein